MGSNEVGDWLMNFKPDMMHKMLSKVLVDILFRYLFLMKVMDEKVLSTSAVDNRSVSKFSPNFPSF